MRKHHTTPQKAKIHGAIEYLEAKGASYSKRDVYELFGVSGGSVHRVLRSNTTRRLHNAPNKPEPRGRKCIITQAQKDEMEQIIEREEIQGRALTWQQLGFEVNVKASGDTVKRMMRTLDYRKCIACKKGWMKPKVAARHLEYARHMLEKYPEPED